MQFPARLSTAAFAVSAVLVAASCGGTGDGGSGAFGPGSNGGSGSSGGSAGYGSSGASSGGTFGGSSGSNGGGSSGSGVGTDCYPPGSTRACCGNGTQTCAGAGEFPVWGQCLDSSGATLTCTVDAGGAVPGTGGEDSGGPGTPGNGFEDAAVPDYCNNNPLSTEPEILVGYYPQSPQTVGQGGQIKVWVNDENPICVAPGEQIDPNTGQVTAPGARTATSSDGLLWEPALYLAPQTPQNGGTPHFPQNMKGDINNTLFTGDDCSANSGGIHVSGMDPVPPPANLQEVYTAEFIWDVSVLGLGPGNYVGVFVVHDGDTDRAIGCVNIVITQGP